MLAFLVALPAGCARPTPSVAGVPAGCDPGRSAVEWSGMVQEPVLEHVSLFAGHVPGEGRSLLDSPVTAAITGLAAPDTWLPILAGRLASETSTDVQTVRPSTAYGMDFGFSGEVNPDITESIVYQGVHRISATFTVDCEPKVSGTFTAWTETKTGGVMCGDRIPPEDLYGQAARRYCPRTPHPLPSDEPGR